MRNLLVILVFNLVCLSNGVFGQITTNVVFDEKQALDAVLLETGDNDVVEELKKFQSGRGISDAQMGKMLIDIAKGAIDEKQPGGSVNCVKMNAAIYALSGYLGVDSMKLLWSIAHRQRNPYLRTSAVKSLLKGVNGDGFSLMADDLLFKRKNQDGESTANYVRYLVNISDISSEEKKHAIVEVVRGVATTTTNRIVFAIADQFMMKEDKAYANGELRKVCLKKHSRVNGGNDPLESYLRTEAGKCGALNANE